ncbi:hypothetical protein [Streptomyces sp. MH60]|uniref:hypothetical protein n=1 Tax=Streptomyces sp. MH60 TaxID=1940758 RepID=UPI000CEDB537|nr:hypothetical protein [Streptomyces sp. MH60]PPS89595.1 hypothetical protein BZZ08_01742 [Streptomyces sp. MH60]
MSAPDAGATFEHEGHTYRVDGWLKRMAPPEPPGGQRSPFADILGELLYETQQRTGPDRERLVFCTQDEAEYVSGYGVAGCIVRVRDVRVTGMVAWSPEEIRKHQERAVRMAGLTVG